MLHPHSNSPMDSLEMLKMSSGYGIGARSSDPSKNNAPLEFGKPRTTAPQPIVNIGSDSEDSSDISSLEEEGRRRIAMVDDRDYRDRDERWDDFRESRRGKQVSERIKSPMPIFIENRGIPPESAAAQASFDGIQQPWGIMYPLMNVANDPAMMGMLPMNYSQYNYMAQPDPAMTSIVPLVPVPPGPVKEIIHCKSCTLFPPSSNGPPQTTRDRPPGCRTVFVGGLPENITEEILKEIFERCGGIITIRMSKKNFCHLRFDSEIYVENAIYLSGYHVRIGSHTDAANCGRLHVDYACARDDLYEWECMQRQIQREQRHRQRMEQERMRPKSPPPVTHYSDHEASLLTERMKAAANHTGQGGPNPNEGGVNAFPKAIQTLITWLERGDCSKRNSGQFYSMIQSSNSHVRRLMAEKSHYEEELARAKEQINYRMQGIIAQFNQIEKVFTAASHQKVWDHFTKAQRKNIDTWKKQVQEIKNVQTEYSLRERVEDEMDFSEDEAEGGAKKMRFDADSAGEQISSLTLEVGNLKEENDSLRCQLEAYKNEVDLIKAENLQEMEEKNKQIKSLQQALQGMQQQLIQVNQQRTKDEEAVQNLQKILNSEKDTSGEESVNESAPTSSEIPFLDKTQSSSPPPPKILDRDAKLIGLLSTFLHVHPFGASVDYICSFLQRLNASIKPSDVESLLMQFPSVFRQELTGVGASLERKWVFTGFQTI